MERIDRCIDRVDQRWDAPKLLYIRSQIIPEGLALRPEWDQDVRHLHQVAEQILRGVE